MIIRILSSSPISRGTEGFDRGGFMLASGHATAPHARGIRKSTQMPSTRRACAHRAHGLASATCRSRPPETPPRDAASLEEESVRMRYLVAAALSVVLVTGCSGSKSSPTGPSNTPAPTPTADPTDRFGAGQHLVSNIGAGRYYSDPADGCYWERLSGLGGTLGEIITNEFIGFDSRQEIVDILASDLAFDTNTACGRWFNAARVGMQSDLRPGKWLVGSQVAPGTYSATVGDGCYWERLRNFEGGIDAIIANDFVATGGARLITIGANDVGFSNDGDCGTWTPASASDAVVETQSKADIARNRELRRQRR